MLYTEATSSPDYGAINPFHTVPAMDEDNFLLVESEAILKFIAGKKEVAKHWYPTTPRHRAKVDEYMAWQHGGIRAKSIDMIGEVVSSSKSISMILSQSILSVSFLSSLLSIQHSHRFVTKYSKNLY